MRWVAYRPMICGINTASGINAGCVKLSEAGVVFLAQLTVPLCRKAVLKPISLDNYILTNNRIYSADRLEKENMNCWIFFQATQLMVGGTATITAAAAAGSQQCDNTDSRRPDDQYFFKRYTRESRCR